MKFKIVNMATNVKKAAKPTEKRVYVAQDDDLSFRISRIESKLVYMNDLEKERQFEDDMNRIVAKERARANTQYWLGLLTGVCYGIIVTVSWIKKYKIGSAHARQY